MIVDAPAAVALVEQGAVVLDTRGPTDFWWRHIPGAVRVDWRIGTTGGLLSGRMDEPAVVAAAFAALGVDEARPVLVVGDWSAGWGEEGRIAWDLSWLGHASVFVLEGGMSAWSGPTTSLPAEIRPGRFSPRPREELRADRTEVKAATLLVDVREADEFGGARRYGEARGGHVPGAVNLPWRQLLEGNPALPKSAPVVVYCTGGVRSGMAWLRLTELGYQVANYDGSWWEWAREE